LRVLWENYFLPLSLKKTGAEIFWGPTNFLPSVKACRYLVTIHDVTAFVFPQYLPALRRFYYRNSIATAIRMADRIVGVSTQIKKDLIQVLKVPAEKITVIPNGLDEQFRNQAKSLNSTELKLDPQIKEKYSLPDSFIFTLGVLEPKKNITNLVRAYAMLKQMGIKDLPKLVVGGSKEYGWKNQAFFKTVMELNLLDAVIFTGNILHADLPAIYRAATVFVLPSLYEGFGLPVIEAMACGTPVITSNTSSLPEVAGNAAILVNPYSPQEIANAIIQVLSREEQRKAMIENGRKNALRFSWDRTAQELLRVFEEVNPVGARQNVFK